MSLPFVTRGKPCPRPGRRKKVPSLPAWRPPPCKFERRLRRKSGGTYCSVCAPQNPRETQDGGGDSLQNLKELNSSIHRLDEEIRKQKGKVLRGLSQMEPGGETWRTSLAKSEALVCTCNLDYKTLEQGASMNKKMLPENDDSTQASESIHKDPIKKEISTSSSSSSSDRSDKSHKKLSHKRKKVRRKAACESKETLSMEDSDNKVWKTVIAQLRNENEGLREELRERDAKLQEAGKTIQEILEQNTLLTHRLKELTFKGCSTIRGGSSLGAQEMAISGESYQKELSLLRQKLSDSQIANRNLETYIEYLKKSYVSVFGSVVTSI